MGTVQQLAETVKEGLHTALPKVSDRSGLIETGQKLFNTVKFRSTPAPKGGRCAPVKTLF